MSTGSIPHPRSGRLPQPARTIFRTAPVALVAACLAVAALTAPPPARAYRVAVLDPGSQQVDLGMLRDDQLVHATLRAPGADLVLTFAPVADAETLVELLVPDDGVEARARPGDLVRTTVRGAAAARSIPVHRASTTRSDTAGGVRYRSIGELRLLGGDAAALTGGSGPLTVTTRRGGRPVRIAVRVGARSRFGFEDANAAPRTLARLQGWASTPASGRRSRDSASDLRHDERNRRRTAVLASTLACVMLLVAAWWVRNGRAAARARPGSRRR